MLRRQGPSDARQSEIHTPELTAPKWWDFRGASDDLFSPLELPPVARAEAEHRRLGKPGGRHAVGEMTIEKRVARLVRTGERLVAGAGPGMLRREPS